MSEEDQTAFREELETFYKERNKKFRNPIFCGAPLNLLKLWREVIRLGGHKKVTLSKLWSQVADTFRPPPTCTKKAYLFKKYYRQRLLDYEAYKLTRGELDFNREASVRDAHDGGGDRVAEEDAHDGGGDNGDNTAEDQAAYIKELEDKLREAEGQNGVLQDKLREAEGQNELIKRLEEKLTKAEEKLREAEGQNELIKRLEEKLRKAEEKLTKAEEKLTEALHFIRPDCRKRKRGERC